MNLLLAKALLPRLSAGNLISRTVSAGSYLLSTTVSVGSKRSRTVSAEANYDGRSLQEALIGGLVYTLCLSIHTFFAIGFDGGIWDMIVLVPDHYLSFLPCAYLFT